MASLLWVLSFFSLLGVLFVAISPLGIIPALISLNTALLLAVAATIVDRLTDIRDDGKKRLKHLEEWDSVFLTVLKQIRDRLPPTPPPLPGEVDQFDPAAAAIAKAAKSARRDV